jgi:membrane protein YdbS with pleckstrin-like domain
MFNVLNLNAHLDSDEKILLFFRPSRKAYILGYALYIILYLVGVFLFVYRPKGSPWFIFWAFMNNLGILLIAFSVIMLIRLEYRILSRRYALTTERILYSRGIFSEFFRSTGYGYVTDIKFSQTFWDKILNTGTLVIDTSGTDKYEIRYRKISDPLRVKKIINDMQARPVMAKKKK